MLTYNYIALVLVGFLWGATNPLIKLGSVGIDNVQTNGRAPKILQEILFLATRWQYIVPFLLNQCGSVIYVFALQNADLSMAVPIANSCTFVFTALMAMCIGEKMPSPRAFVGMALIVVGISICVYSKQM